MSYRCVAIMASGDNKMDRRIEENMVEVERRSLCKHVSVSVCHSLSLAVTSVSQCSVAVGRNLWIGDIHGSACAIYGSILWAEIHGLRRYLWIELRGP